MHLFLDGGGGGPDVTKSFPPSQGGGPLERNGLGREGANLSSGGLTLSPLSRRLCVFWSVRDSPISSEFDEESANDQNLLLKNALCQIKCRFSWRFSHLLFPNEKERPPQPHFLRRFFPPPLRLLPKADFPSSFSQGKEQGGGEMDGRRSRDGLLPRRSKEGSFIKYCQSFSFHCFLVRSFEQFDL